MLFKILQGDASRISTDITPFHEGWCYVTYDGSMYIDMNLGTADEPDNQRVMLNGTVTVPMAIPAGRMYGDLNGDGVIDNEDVPVYQEVFGKLESSYEEVPLEFYLSDFNKNGMSDTDDFRVFKDVYSGADGYGRTGNDYTGNYIANPNYSTETAQFYCDIPCSASSVNDILISIASENVDSSIFVKAEIIEGAIRIWVKRPPISDIECFATIINNGSGKCSISGGDSSVYVDYVKSVIDADIAELKKMERKKYSIPAGRMYGDLNGDGLITEEDFTIFQDVFNNENNYIGTDTLVLADIDKSGGIGTGDLRTFRTMYQTKQYGGAGNDYTGNYIANTNFATETAQFYTDITVVDMTTSCNVSVEIATPEVDSSIFVKAEPIDGAVRIWVTRPPISSVDCLISFNEGDGVGVITGGDNTIYVNKALEGISSDTIVEQNKSVEMKFWVGTKAEYDAIATKDPNTLYTVTDEEPTSSFEDVANKTTVLDETSTDLQYPTAKAVFNKINTAATGLDEAKLNTPLATTVTLPVAGWDSSALTQVVEIAGISASATQQMVDIYPVANLTNIKGICDAVVVCIGQGENALTFSCDSVPEVDVQFYVSWHDVIYTENGVVTEEVILSSEGAEF